MKSSFKKIQKATSNNKCHFGHPQFDAIFNCSLSKGHLMILEQDHPSINYLSLLRCYVSSNYNNGVPSLIYDTVPSKWTHLISPIDKKKVAGKDDSAVKQQSSMKQKENNSNNSRNNGKNANNVNDKNDNKSTSNEMTSQIAWRYNKMNIKLNQLMVNEKMSFIDLNKTVPKIDQTLLSKNQYPRGTLQEFYKDIQQKFINLNENQKDTRPKKILLASVPSYFYQQGTFWNFLKALRCMTRSSHVFTLITIPPIVSEQIRKKLVFFSDYYVQIGKIGKGYNDFSATISIIKQVETCSVKTNHRGVSIWGIKNKKKQFRIQSLYEQAVEEEQETEQIVRKDFQEGQQKQSSKGQISVKTPSLVNQETIVSKKDLKKPMPITGNIDF